MNRLILRAFLTLLFIAAFFNVMPVRAQSQDAKELNRLGSIAIRSGNYPEAAELLKKATKMDPNWAEPYYNIAQLLRMVQKREKMKEALKKACELEPINPTYRDEYSKALKEDLRTARDAKDAVAIKNIRDEILKINPTELEIGSEIVLEAVASKNIDRAKSLSLFLLEKNQAELPQYRSPQIGLLYSVLAKIEMDGSNVKQAKDYCEKALRYPLESPDETKGMLSEIKKAQKEAVEGHIKLGKACAAKGQVQEALDQFNEAQILDPTNDEIMEQIALVQNRQQAKEVYAGAMKHVSGEKWLEARDMLERVLELEPNHAEAKKLLAKAKRFEEELMKKLGRADRLPRNSVERANLTKSFIDAGKVFMDRGSSVNLKEARINFDKALAIIALDAKLDKFKLEIEAATSKIDRIDNLKTLWDKARDQYKSQEWDECLKNLEQLPIDYTIDLMSYLAMCQWKKGNNDKAKELANRQLAKQADNNRAKFVLGNIFLTDGDNATAFKFLKDVKDVDPEYPGIDDPLMKAGASKWGPIVIPLLVVLVLLWIAHSMYKKLPEYNKNAAISQARGLLNKGLFKECIDELNNIKRLPNLTQYDGALISRILAQAYLKTAVYDKAIGECKHLIAITDQDAEAHKWLGFAYLGRRMVTPESLTELLSLYKGSEGKNLALLSLLGQHYSAQKSLSTEGVEVLERWLELDPNNPEVLKPLGRLYLQKGRSDDTAMRVFQAMMDFVKPEPEFMLGIAKIHLKHKRFEECLKLCENVLSMDVNNDLVHSVLRECYQKTDRLPELIEIYRAFLAENPYNVAFQKGLTEATKLINRQQSTSSRQARADAPAPQEGTEPEVLCPHCNKSNAKADYYCQHCGKSIA